MLRLLSLCAKGSLTSTLRQASVSAAPACTQQLFSGLQQQPQNAPLPHLWAQTAYFSAAQLDAAQARQAMANKLLYRSKQRGFLELDLLMGLWAEENIPHMDMSMMEEFSIVLDQENPDVFKWLTGQQPVPENMLANSAFRALYSNVQSQLNDKRSDQAVTPSGKEWSRGWDDLWRNPSNHNVPKNQ